MKSPPLNSPAGVKPLFDVRRTGQQFDLAVRLVDVATQNAGAHRQPTRPHALGVKPIDHALHRVGGAREQAHVHDPLIGQAVIGGARSSPRRTIFDDFEKSVARRDQEPVAAGAGKAPERLVRLAVQALDR